MYEEEEEETQGRLVPVGERRKFPVSLSCEGESPDLSREESFTSLALFRYKVNL